MTKVVVRRGKFQFPAMCPGCLRTDASQVQAVASEQGQFSGYYLLFTTSKHLIAQVRFCAACAAENNRMKNIGLALAIVGLLIGVAIGIRFDAGLSYTVALGVIFAGPGIFFAELKSKPVRILNFDDARVTFSFRSPEYAQAFRKLNGA